MQRSATAGGKVGQGGAAKGAATGAASVARVRAAVDALVPGRYLLAVSGGRDSMVLLDAFTTLRTDAVGVATFDHGTGPAATAAADHVVRATLQRELAVMLGHGAGGTQESTWRRQRWEFLRGWAAELRATIVTAHTEDDQVETVFMRALRDAGARGLAAMYAPSPIARPLLGVSRVDAAAYAAERGVEWVEDPSNARVAHLRNRVRLEMLPAIERVRPGFARELLDIARRAADWRSSLAALVDAMGVTALDGAGVRSVDGSGARAAESGELTVIIPAQALETITAEALPLVWQELVGRAGGSLDWRGTERLAAESPKVRSGAEIPLSGGIVVTRTSTTFVVRNRGGDAPLY